MTDHQAGTRADREPGTATGSGGSTLRAVNALLRRRRAILACALGTAALAVGATLLSPAPPPRVTATFRAPPRVAAAMSELAVREGGEAAASGGEAEPVPRIRLGKVADPNVWRITVRSGDAERSSEIARRLLEAGRDVPATEEPEWLVEAWSGLREAEAELSRFVDENPAYEDSPPLQARFDRLERRIELRNDIVVEAERSALLRRVNADPSLEGSDELVVVDPPAVQSSGGILYPALLGLVIGSLLGVLWVLAREGMAGLARRDPDAYEELHGLLSSAGRDLSHPWEMFRRPE